MKPLDTLKSFFKHKKTTQPVVIFDIGSSSIGGAVVFFDKERPHISYSTRIQLNFQEKADQSRLLPQIEETLSQVATDIQKKGLQPKEGATMIPDEIVCVLSSLWSDTQTTSASFENKEKFVVTDTIMDNLLAQIHESNKEGKDENTVTIEEIIINSELNGYSTRSPLGKEVKDIHVTFLESTVTQEVHKKITDAIHGVFSPDTPLFLRSFTLVAFSVVRDMYEDIKDFLVVDVTGEITELAVVKNSTLGDVLSFPYGRNTMIRDIAKKTGSVPEDILARIKIVFSGEDSEMKETVFEEEKKWTEMFGKACGELSSETNPLPQDVFLIADKNYESWFSSMIGKVDFSQFTATKEAFKVNAILGENISNTYTLDSGVSEDSFLIINTLFYNREYLSRRS